VEISLIQRFVLFLGHPTYALTVVVFLLLLSSGAGSAVSRASARISLAAILGVILLYVFALPTLLAAAVGLNFAIKLVLSALFLLPLGFLMGTPFPTGLKLLARKENSGIEWAWAMNAAASVLGSVTAMVIAIHFGLTITLLCAGLAYATAIVCSPALVYQPLYRD